MRGLLILLITATATPASAQIPEQQEQHPEQQEWTANDIVWSQAFSSISSSEPPASLVMLVLTDDDSYATALGEFWCDRIIRRSVEKVSEDRPQLLRQIEFQAAQAGLPAVLVGGSHELPPQRAIVAICDRQFRLLSFAIGVPTASELQTLIEDAEQIQVALGPKTDRVDAAEELAMKRSRSRLVRIWQQQLADVSATLIGASDPLADPDAEVSDADIIRRMSMAADDYQDLYLADAAQRFGLGGKQDRLRLVRLEQHVETRRPWCEAMTPLVVGHDFRELWRPLAEIVWGQPVVVRAELSPMLEAWWSSVAQHETVCLAVLPATRANQPRWPPLELPAASKDRRASWQDLQAVIAELSSRKVTAQQLTALIHAKELSAIEFMHPTPARYLLFRTGTDRPLVIREGDVPSLVISQVKRLAG